MTTAVIVQARVGSSRLRGKVLKPLGDHTVLEEVLSRCSGIPGVDVVVCAIPDGPEDDALAPVADRAGAVVARGPALDVLARYAKAARRVDADVIVRVTSDCPLIDPRLCGDVVRLRQETAADYAANNMPRSFPHGLDCEVFTREAMERAEHDARAPEEREHVTPWLRTRPEFCRAGVHGPGGAAAEQRWTLDFPEDYAFLTALWPLLHSERRTDWTAVMAVLTEHPELAAINRMHHARPPAAVAQPVTNRDRHSSDAPA